MTSHSSLKSHKSEPAPGDEGASHPFPVVGVGASAGGLEAFTELLKELPPNPGMAFIFVVHLEPHHESHLAEVLSRVTPLPVRQVTEGMAIEVNHVYLIPPNSNLALTDGKLALSPRSKVPGQHMPVDHLFRSLATIQKNRAIGVILSGGGTDGTLGFQSIKAEEGITFAQDERTAKQSSMPRSAVLDGCVDYVLDPKEISQKLMQLARHPYAKEPSSAVDRVPVGDGIRDIMDMLRATTHVDFSHYKETTIRRRIFRRMALLGLEKLDDYLLRLREDHAELQQLFQDFLIRVTQFFRDPDAFEVLKSTVFPVLIKDKTSTTPIRIWVAGCSTGEEVYSLAICLLEYLDDKSASFPIKILATDLNESALEKARAGVYVDNIEIDVSPERLRRFFIRGEGHYQINKTVRDLCIFSRQNMATDPPFSHLDLVSCRNVLIYLDNALQKRVLPILHYALKVGGFLFLGASENIGSFSDLFEPVDSKHRIFAKRPATPNVPVDFAAAVSGEGRGRFAPREEGAPLWTALDVQKEADRSVMARFAPVGVIIDETATVLQFRGRTAPYLEPAPGLATLDLFRMLREGLLAEVRSALNQAKTENVPVVREGIQLADGSETRQVRVDVVPFKVPPKGVRFFLVMFTDMAQLAKGMTPAPPAPPPRPPPDQQSAQLQQELTALREYLQSVIEEQESTNEELKAANEEILSANEELQSTNEELQTAKEESQSANEELATVNEELRHRNAELARVNDDLVNVLAGVNIPIITVGRDLRIRRYTPLAEKLFNLIPTDVARPISDIKSNLSVPDLPKLLTDVIDGLAPHEGEVQDKQGRWYSMRIRPYITLDGKIEGASIVLLDIAKYMRRPGAGPDDEPAGQGEGETKRPKKT